MSDIFAGISAIVDFFDPLRKILGMALVVVALIMFCHSLSDQTIRTNLKKLFYSENFILWRILFLF